MSMFGGSRNRRRRRRGGSSIRRTPEQLALMPRRSKATELLACGAIGVICVALVVLVWINTERAIREQMEDTRGRVEAAISAQAATLAVQVQHELLMVDQSLSVLQAAWDDNQDTFSLADWRKKMPALVEGSDDLFIADGKHVIVQDINPAAVGQGIGSAYANFASGSLEPLQSGGPRGRDNAMLVGELGSGAVIRQYLMYLVRPLAKPEGWIIGASYRSSALGTVFALAGLGKGGVAALIDTHLGGVQAVAGVAALRPRLNVGSSPMYAAMRDRTDGVWIGPTAIDGVQRIIAFRRVPGRDLLVMVGMPRDQALAPAETWAAGAHSLATLGSLLILAIGAAMMWEIWYWRRNRHRRRSLAQAETALAGMQGDLAMLRAREALDAAQLHALLGGVSEGVAIVNADHHLTAWNPRFAGLSGLTAEALREGMPLEDVVRQQVAAGRFGAPDDAEAEVARVTGELRQEAAAPAQLAMKAPDGTDLVLLGAGMPDGGLVLILLRADALPVIAPVAAADPVEW